MEHCGLNLNIELYPREKSPILGRFSKTLLLRFSGGRQCNALWAGTDESTKEKKGVMFKELKRSNLLEREYELMSHLESLQGTCVPRLIKGLHDKTDKTTVLIYEQYSLTLHEILVLCENLITTDYQNQVSHEQYDQEKETFKFKCIDDDFVKKMTMQLLNCLRQFHEKGFFLGTITPQSVALKMDHTAFFLVDVSNIKKKEVGYTVVDDLENLAYLALEVKSDFEVPWSGFRRQADVIDAKRKLQSSIANEDNENGRHENKTYIKNIPKYLKNFLKYCYQLRYESEDETQADYGYIWDALVGEMKRDEDQNVNFDDYRFEWTPKQIEQLYCSEGMRRIIWERKITI